MLKQIILTQDILIVQVFSMGNFSMTFYSFIKIMGWVRIYQMSHINGLVSIGIILKIIACLCIQSLNWYIVLVCIQYIQWSLCNGDYEMQPDSLKRSNGMERTVFFPIPFKLYILTAKIRPTQLRPTACPPNCQHYTVHDAIQRMTWNHTQNWLIFNFKPCQIITRVT